MRYRKFSDTGWKVSEIGLGCWALGGSWTDITEKNGFKILNQAVNEGVNFFDTSDQYGDGKSERILGKFKKSTSQKIYIATKIGTKLKPHLPELYQEKIFEKFLDDSLKRLQLDTIDLMQIHCPPLQLCSDERIYEMFDNFIKKGKIKFYGASVFTLNEAYEIIKFPNIKSIQMVFNMFRQKPSDAFFRIAKKKNISIIARGSLASGLLTGTIDEKSKFTNADHRSFNKEGKRFNIGDTFSGLDIKKTQKALFELKKILPNDHSLIDIALGWILSHKEVTVVIPGATHPSQVIMNTKTSKHHKIKNLIPKINIIYEKYIKSEIHDRW